MQLKSKIKLLRFEYNMDKKFGKYRLVTRIVGGVKP